MTLLVDLTALETRLRSHVATLARAPRTPGSREHRQAREYIADHLDRAGFDVQETSFHENGLAGVNLLTQPVPADPKMALVIIGAHYDTKQGTRGADDNASAVAALLELASWIGPDLQTRSFSHRLQLAAYDLEEWGMIGSFIHSREVQRSRVPVRGMISLEMLGYTDSSPGSQHLPPHLAKLYPDVGNFIGICGNDVSLGLLQTVAQAMKSIDGLPVECLAVPANGQLLPEVRLSDHSAFWDRGFQALMITDTSFFRNPHYHLASDTPETLDYPFLAKVTAGVFETVSRLTQ